MSGKTVIAQAIDMVERQDLCHWSDAHDRVTLAALREYRANWRDADPGQQWKCGDEFLPFHPSASHVPPEYRDGWNRCYWMALGAGRSASGALAGGAPTVSPVGEDQRTDEQDQSGVQG